MVRQRQLFDQPRVILCEGPADASFLRALVKKRQLPPCNIRNPADRNETAKGGIDQIGATLEGFASTVGFPEVEHLIILVDSDLDPLGNFRKVCKQISEVTTHRFSAPDEPLLRSGGKPAISIVLAPWIDERGNLESFVLNAALDQGSDLASCVDQFAECAGVTAWSEETKIAKFRLRVALAARHRRDPFVGLGRVWDENETLIPLEHECFDRLANFLATFG